MPGLRGVLTLHVDRVPTAPVIGSILDAMGRAYTLLAWTEDDGPPATSGPLSEAFIRFMVGHEYSRGRIEESIKSGRTGLLFEDEVSVEFLESTLLPGEDRLLLDSFALTNSFILKFSGLARPLEVLWKIFDPEERRHRARMHRLDEAKEQVKVQALIRKEMKEAIEADQKLRGGRYLRERHDLEILVKLTSIRQVQLLNGLASEGVTFTRLEIEDGSELSFTGDPSEDLPEWKD